MAINLTLVSPSCVGDYACCPQRLVLDSRFGKTYRSNPAADFGTICHYATQGLLGVAPEKEPSAEVKANAKTLRGFASKSDEEFWACITKCAMAARDALPVPPAPLTWVSEHKAYDKSILPTRVGRKGEISGFGGDVDLLLSDRSELWDLKFVGEVPNMVKTVYLWQLGSYHIVSKVPKTGILFVTRNGDWTGKLQIDWSTKEYAAMADTIRNFLKFIDLANFEHYAYPLEGEHCKYCEHKSRCALKLLPKIEGKMQFALPEADLSWIVKEEIPSVI